MQNSQQMMVCGGAEAGLGPDPSTGCSVNPADLLAWTFQVPGGWQVHLFPLPALRGSQETEAFLSGLWFYQYP